MKNFRTAILLLLLSLSICTWENVAFAAISFVSATNSANLVSTVDDNGNTVFVFSGIADGESSVLNFSIDTTCPGVAMTGGAEFGSPWTCASGVITATVTYRGGLSFGPGTPENAGTFYVTFSDPPAPAGSDTAPAALTGIQISVYGDISSWNLSGEMTDSGALFGVELSGEAGAEAHFRMDLPQVAVDFLGGILGVYIGGKADPFATVSTHEDGSASIAVDIAALTSSKGALVTRASKKSVTKKITAGERTLSVGFDKTSAKSGKSVNIAACAGTDFTAGDKIAAHFTLGSTALSLKKNIVLDATGCGQASVKLKSVSAGTLTAKVSYKGKKAKSTLKVTK